MKITIPLLVLLSSAPCLAVPVSLSVVDEKGSPVSGADVELQQFVKSKMGTQTATTDARGVATFDVARKDETQTYVGRIAIWKNEFAVGGGDLTLKTPLKVVLHPSLSISGTLVDSNRKPVVGATVSLNSYSTSGRGIGIYLFDGAIKKKMQVVSGTDGTWKIDHVPANVSSYVAIEGKGWANATAQVTTGGTVQTELHLGASVAGRVLGLDGKPLAGVAVSARQLSRDTGFNSYGSAKTGDDGTFQIDGLEKGAYNVRFTPIGDDRARFVVAGVTNVQATPEKVAQLPDAHAVEGILLSGQVVAQDTKQPLGDVYIGLQRDDDPESTTSATTDSQGKWQMRALAGTGHLYVGGVPQGFVRDAQQRLVFDTKTRASDLNFALRRATKITGRVVDENGHGVQTSGLGFRQQYEEYPFVSDAEGNFTAYGPKNGEVEVGRPSWGGDDETPDAPKWDVVGPTKFSIPSTQPLTIKVRRAQLFRLDMGVFDQDDAAVEGATVVVTLLTQHGDSGTSYNKDLISDKMGRVHLDGIRADETVSIQSATKDGFDTAPLPKVEKVNGVYGGDITLNHRGGAAKGQVLDVRGTAVEGASVFGSGIETTTDFTGHFVLSPLPSGKTQILAWKDVGFALALSDTTRLDLKPQTLEKPDFARSKAINAALLEESKGTGYWRRSSLESQPLSGDFATDTQMALASKKTGIPRLIERYGNEPAISQEEWFSIFSQAATPSERIYYTAFWLSKNPTIVANDAAAGYLRLLEADVPKIENGPANDERWENATGLFALAGFAERLGQTAKADELFEHGNAYVQQHFPEKEDKQNNSSQDNVFEGAADAVAVSPRLFSKLVALVETDSPSYSQLLQQGIPTLAHIAGLDAARPFLDQLKKAPQPKPDANGNTTSIDWSWSRAIISSIHEGGKSNPQLALELAQSLPKNATWSQDDSRPRALTEAAFSQPPAAARGLWDASLPELGAGDAMRFIALIAQTDSVLARGYYEKVLPGYEEDAAKHYDAMMYHPDQTPAFAFYETRFAPARARYHLEKGFQKANKTGDYRYNLTSYIRAMAVFDTDRALVWAKELGNSKDDFTGFEGERMTARWLSLDDKARAQINFGDRFSQGDDF